MVVASIYAVFIVLQVLGGVIAGLSFANIFQYEKLKRQLAVCTVGILLLLVWIGLFCYDHYYIHGGATMYPLYAMLPVVCIILFLLARKGIKHFIHLLKSADRVR